MPCHKQHDLFCRVLNSFAEINVPFNCIICAVTSPQLFEIYKIYVHLKFHMKLYTENDDFYK